MPLPDTHLIPHVRRIAKDLPPTLDDIMDGETILVDLRASKLGPSNPNRDELRLYYRIGDRLFYHMPTEVK